MKFRVKEPGGFKHTAINTEQHQHFEEGNTYDSETHGLCEPEVDMFHRAGWVSIEGKPEVERDIYRSVPLHPDSIKHTVSADGH